MRYSGCMGTSLAKQPRQPLTVTAALTLALMLALLAAAAATGTAGMAIASNPAEVSTSPGAKCNSVEIYKPVLAVVSARGVNLGGAVQGSDIGCIPVCVLTFPTLSHPADMAASKLELADLSQYELTLSRWTSQLDRDSLVTLTKAEAELLVAGAADPARGLIGALAQLGEQVSGKSLLFRTPTSVYLGVGTGIYVADFSEVLRNVYRIAEVGVLPNPDNKQCRAYSSAGEILGSYSEDDATATIIGTFSVAVFDALDAVSEIMLRSVAEAEAAERAAQESAAGGGGVALWVWIASIVAAVAALAGAAGAVIVARARKAKSERGTSEVSASAGSGGGGSPEGGSPEGGSPEGGNIPESPSSGL